MIWYNKHMKGKVKIMEKNYTIKQTNENTWVIVDNESGKIINTITKKIIFKYCKNTLKDYHIETVCAYTVISGVVSYMENKHYFNYIDYYQGLGEFLAWLDYTCAEYLANEITSLYKQRLLNHE